MTTYTRPPSVILSPGAMFGKHVLPDRPADFLIKALVQAVYSPQEWSPAWAAQLPPAAPELIDLLLYYVPAPDDPRRAAWLARCDEVCAAWGRPLYGDDGLCPYLAGT